MARRHFVLPAVVLCVLAMHGCNRDVEPLAPEQKSVELPVFLLRSADRDVDSCEVHREGLRDDRVPVVYGLLMYPPGYHDAWETSFPHANSHVPGGCLVGTISSAPVHYCQSCRDAETAWHRSNPPDREVETIVITEDSTPRE